MNFERRIWWIGGENVMQISILSCFVGMYVWLYMYWRIGREESISAWAQGAFRCLLVLTVRWSFVFLPARRGVPFEMQMARMGVCLGFDLLTWE